MCVNLETTRNNNKYNFGKAQQNSLGSTSSFMSITDHRMTTEQIDAGKTDAPLLLGLKLLQKYMFYVHSIRNCICFSKRNIEPTPIWKRSGFHREWSEMTVYCKRWKKYLSCIVVFLFIIQKIFLPSQYSQSVWEPFRGNGNAENICCERYICQGIYTTSQI